MSSKRKTSEAVQAARRAVSRIRAYGLDGPRPIEEIEELAAHEDAMDGALEVVIDEAEGENLAAAIHLAVLLRRAGVLEAVRRAAFERPADLVAKREALQALRACAAPVDDDLVARVEAIERMQREPDAAALEELSIWPEAWREPALAAWLQAAGPELLGAVEGALGRAPKVDDALLEWVGTQATAEAGELLQRYLTAAGDGDKERVKRAKRALHRMRSQGVEVADPEVPGAAGGFTLAIETDALQDARAYITSIDGRGARLLWVLWRSASGGSRLLQAVVDDTAGLREAEVATVTRSGFRDYIKKVDADAAILLAQIDVPLAIGILREAAALSERIGAELPAAYRELAVLVGGADVAGEAEERIYEFVNAAEVRGDAALLDEAMTLLREPHFRSWAIEGEGVEAAAKEVEAAETSTVMVSDEQRRERMQDAIRDAVRTAFDDDTRRLYRRRLELMAAMLWDRGEEAAARQAVAAAIGLTEVEDLFHGHAFARALTHRGVWLAYQDRQRAAAAERQRSRVTRP